MKILITGANGFIGKILCARLLQEGHQLIAVIRQNLNMEAWLALNKNCISQADTLYPNKHFQFCLVDDIGPDTAWENHLKNIDIVIHLAARVHVMHETADDPLLQFRLVNLEGTRHLAQQALNAGVKRFVYLSSIKVNGEETTSDPFTEQSLSNPRDSYSISKWESEQVLQNIAHNSTMDFVIIRPPLVYGPGVGGNFLRLMMLVKNNIPLPFKQIHNRRSMIYVENLVNFIILAMQHTQAANQLFLVSDDEDLSTAQLVQYLAIAMQKSPKLFNVSYHWLIQLAKILGKEAYIKRLTTSLQINCNKAKTMLNWKPTITVEKAISDTVAWYKKAEIK